jgi:hypothetical protein
MIYRKLLATAILIIGGLASFSSANASTVYAGTNIDWTVGSSDSLSKIYLDGESGSYSITGHIGSQGGSILVDFNSSTLLQSGSGLSNIKAAASTEAIADLLVTPNLLFSALRFSLNMPSQSNDSVKMTVTFSDDSTESRDFTCCGGGNELGNGLSKVLVKATGSLFMKSLHLEGALSSFGGFDQIKQFEISTVTAPAPVPVPAAVWLFGTALFGFIGMSRRTNV